MAADDAAPRRLAGIEAGRGIAATFVVLYHVARHMFKAVDAPLEQGILQFGHAGVDFFFVISGFIILYVHYADIGKPARLRRYLGRQFTRLIPTYWVALALTVVIDLAAHHGAPSLADLALSASLLPSNRDMVLGVAWTLRFEFLFYALFCVLIINRAAGMVVLALWLIATISAWLFAFDAVWLPAQFYSAYNLEFFLGMSAACVLHNHTVLRPRVVLAAGFLLFATTAVLKIVHALDGYGNGGRLAYGMAAAIMVLGIAEADRQDLLRVPWVLRTLGRASYSVYLFQFVFIGTAWQALRALHLDQPLPPVLVFLALALAAVGGGVAMSGWVEHPLMRLICHRAGAIRPHSIESDRAF